MIYLYYVVAWGRVKTYQCVGRLNIHVLAINCPHIWACLKLIVVYHNVLNVIDICLIITITYHPTNAMICIIRSQSFSTMICPLFVQCDFLNDFPE